MGGVDFGEIGGNELGSDKHERKKESMEIYCNE
ncbi:uncharacterized protein G2W53_034151 [Senna tora]|uniref:Uncharacterized protein n=1 Tax=Senna tora TaxID=362788 RepID=A0A834SZX1_9FABA|nr:uncharacterized protein G2W53_034151 [Senna tora]